MTGTPIKWRSYAAESRRRSSRTCGGLANNPIAIELEAQGLALRRENWIKANYMPNKPPDPWTAEHETELPEPLQRSQ
jgi:hypothetical protein